MRDIQRFPNLGHNLCENDKQTLINYEIHRENDWRTDNLTNNRRVFNCDKRRIETNQLLITSLHSQ